MFLRAQISHVQGANNYLLSTLTFYLDVAMAICLFDPGRFETFQGRTSQAIARPVPRLPSNERNVVDPI